jgi:hypothetical protein
MPLVHPLDALIARMRRMPSRPRYAGLLADYIKNHSECLGMIADKG